MSKKQDGQTKTRKTALAVAGVTPLVFIGNLWWLKDQPDPVVYALTGLAAAVVLIATLLAAVQGDRQSGEWERAGDRFAHQWGALAGGSFVALLLAVPAVQDAILSLATLVSAGEIDRATAMILFTAGLGSVIITQMIFTVIIGAVWRRKMGQTI
ncbi:MAG: hypothetical protein AAF830_03230 [Pseudomonadota bacterium]